MNCFKLSKALFLLIFIIPFVFSFGQEEEESQDVLAVMLGVIPAELPQKPLLPVPPSTYHCRKWRNGRNPLVVAVRRCGFHLRRADFGS